MTTRQSNRLSRPPLQYSIAFQLRGRFFIICNGEQAEGAPPTYTAEIQTFVDVIPLATGEGPTKAEAIGAAILALARNHRNDLTNKEALSQLTRPTYKVPGSGDKVPGSGDTLTEPAQ